METIPFLLSLGMAELFPQSHYLTPEEEKHLHAGSDGNRRMFYNGIFTTPDEAARYAVQLADNEHEPFYFTAFPKADSWEVELGVAFYQKFLEGNFGGLSNSTKKFQDFMYRYGNTGAIVDAHSRGSLTLGNGMRDFEKHGIHGIGYKTKIDTFGPAFNIQIMANTLDYVSDGHQTHIGLENHADDFVGTKIGKNPYTFEQIPPGSGPWKEAGKIIWSYPSPHACYGNASSICQHDYGLPHRIQIDSNKSGRKK
ncbi:hypothetical protein LBE40_05100 [Bartonella taylorii]|uniref:hypothetical protein n=1 Tax=Bartonella taylorii TaxID=33046 RepID=UPI00208F0435|nr:hypothetical protein [Bartonella taylorii]USP00685.1 hypothetical protein LBE40_05100 [Bartonella taylorii]